MAEQRELERLNDATARIQVHIITNVAKVVGRKNFTENKYHYMFNCLEHDN